MSKNSDKPIAGDTLVVYEDCVWNHHKWKKDDVFICPADVPGNVFKGLLDDRLVGPESARKIDELLLANLVQRQMEAKASNDGTKFKKQAEKVTEEAIKGGGKVKSVDGPVEEVNGDELIAKAEQEWDKKKGKK